MSSYFPNLLKVIDKIASNPSSNLTIQLQPYFKNLFLHEKGCNCCRIWRQRAALTLVNLEYLRQALYNAPDERVNKVIEAFMTICTKNMEQMKDAEFWVYPLEETLDRELLGDSLKVLCNISPKKHISTIEKLYCFKDDSNGFKLCINSKLESLIEDFPALVIDWIESFQLYEFKADNLRSLTLSCMVNNLELAKYLITNDSSKDDILSILDDYVVYDRPRPPPTNLIANFFDKFCVSTLSTSVHKWARQWDRYDKIPNTMKYRTIKNFDHNFFTARSLEERRILTLQTVEASKHSSSHMKEIIKCVKKHADDTFAMAVATFAKKYISLKDVLEVLDDYHHISQSKQRTVDLEVQELVKLQSASQIKRIPRIKFDEFECFLVDDHETFDKLLSALWEHEDRTLAFDVEAGFVCQSEIAGQDAALLQIAFTDDTVYLVDIYTLKKVLNISEWETFFELFLRSRLRRIGFGIKNDLVFLQNAFPFLGKFFANKKPSFICVQDIVKTLSNTEETLTAVFDGKIPQVSLQYITKELLKAELKKEEQSGNWLIRPLDEQKMKYAATDAFYTLKAFFEIKERLNKEQWMELKKTIYQTCEPIKVNQAATFSLFKKKDTFEEVVAHIQNVVKELQLQSLLARKAEENTIVLEPPFLGIRATLKRFGFKTWDHRDGINSKPDKKATEMVKEMEYFLQHLPKDQRPLTYILTNKKTLSQKVMDFEECVIFAEQEQEHSIILERIIRKTYSSIDFSSIYKRCSSCAEVATHFLIPMAAYRTIFKSFATCRNFADNIVGLEDSLETFKDTFNSLSPELKENCSIGGEELIVENGVFRFSINGTDINVTVGNEVSTFKCDTKLFNNENGLDKVKFCWKCKVFY
uniref:3'-5' exonuclease domain-containing protein n=1 Tax=Panagrolaimus davidi TaxID=227884 RepID=A0A914P8H5_9BILA